MCARNATAKPKLLRVQWQGEVYSFTRMSTVPAGFEAQAPYTVALVKLDEGPIVTAQLTDLGDEDVKIGMPVEMVTRRLRSDGDERHPGVRVQVQPVVGSPR